MLREGLRLVLEEQPGVIVIGEGSSGDDALRLAAELKPDLIVMDLNMPGLPAVEAIRRLGGSAPGIRVLVFTGMEENLGVADALAAGASGYVRKDADRDEILLAVKTVANGQIWLSETALAALGGG